MGTSSDIYYRIGSGVNIFNGEYYCDHCALDIIYYPLSVIGGRFVCDSANCYSVPFHYEVIGQKCFMCGYEFQKTRQNQKRKRIKV